MQNTETGANDSESAVRSQTRSVQTSEKDRSSTHLSGRHGEVPPISNSAGEFANIDAGEAADMEEGIRRRPSAPACDADCGADQRRVAGTVLNKLTKQNWTTLKHINQNTK